MTTYLAVLEVRTDLSPASVTSSLAPYSATVHREPLGYLEVVLHVPAESVLQATWTALAVVKEATGGPVVTLEVEPAGAPPGWRGPAAAAPARTSTGREEPRRRPATRAQEQTAGARTVDVRAQVQRHLRVLSTCG